MKNLFSIVFALCLLAVMSGTGQATTVEELARRLDLVTAELQKLKNEAAVSETPVYQSFSGLGPAASKVYAANPGLSIGGYGEAHYSKLLNDRGGKKDQVDFLRFVLYSGYKFNDWIVLNSEIEFEHATTGENGEVALEFATLDFLLHEKFNLRAGLLLVPMGITNELHEPTLFHGNDRPLVERQVLPSTWREMGLGAYGRLAEGLEYKLYLVNGLDAAGFDSTGIRGGRQEGSKATAEDFALVARLDYEPLLGLNLGGSVYLGNSGQDQEFAGGKADVFTRIYELHASYKAHGLELKALGSQVDLEDTAQLAGVPERVTGWYGEIAYDLLPLLIPGTSHYLAPFFRYESIDYRGSSEDVDLYVTGLSYKPIPNVVVKIDYRNFDQKNGVARADEINLGIGFIF